MASQYSIKIEDNKRATVTWDAARDREGVIEFFEFVKSELDSLYELGKEGDTKFQAPQKPSGYFSPVAKNPGDVANRTDDGLTLASAITRLPLPAPFTAELINSYQIKGPMSGRGMSLSAVNKGWFDATRTRVTSNFVTLLKSKPDFARACAALWFKSEEGDKLVSENPIVAAAGGSDSNIPADFGVPLAALSLLRAWGGDSNVEAALEASGALSALTSGAKKPKSDAGESEDKGRRSTGAKEKDDDDDSSSEKDKPEQKTPQEQAADLNKFLADKKDLTDETASLSGMVQKILDRSVNANDPHCYKSYVDAIKDPLVGVGDQKTVAWKGATIEGREFASNDAGLLDFLRFAWVATHGDQLWPDAAREIGFSVGGDILPEDLTVKALIRMGAISPAGLLGISLKGGAIPAGSKLIFSPGVQFTTYTENPQDAIVVDFKRDYSGALITISVKAGAGPAPGVSAPVAPTLSVEESKRVVAAWGQQTTFVLKSGDRSSLVTRALDTGRIEFDIPGAAAAPGAALTGARARISGFSLANAPLIPGVTENTRQDLPFTLENIYLDDSGTERQREVRAELEKTANSVAGRDNFKIRMLGGDYALIPVTLKRAPTQAAADVSNATHWAAVALGAAPGAAKKLAYVPVTEISWSFKGNYKTYGGGSLPEVIAVDAIAAPTDVVTEQGITVISLDEAEIEAVDGAGPFGPFDDALADYLASNRNPIGKPLVMTPRLNSTISNIPIRVMRTF